MASIARRKPEQNRCKSNALMDWPSFSPILKRALSRSGIGPYGYDLLVLFKCLLIGQWHGLGDPKLERALKVQLDFMVFCGLDLQQPVSDKTAHGRFRKVSKRPLHNRAIDFWEDLARSIVPL